MESEAQDFHIWVLFALIILSGDWESDICETGPLKDLSMCNNICVKLLGKC